MGNQRIMAKIGGVLQLFPYAYTDRYGEIPSGTIRGPLMESSSFKSILHIWKSPICPSCRTNEDTHHVLAQCPDYDHIIVEGERSIVTAAETLWIVDDLCSKREALRDWTGQLFYESSETTSIWPGGKALYHVDLSPRRLTAAISGLQRYQSLKHKCRFSS